MTDSNYNGMFRVSPEKRKFLDVKTGISTEQGFHEKCKYDMHNFAIYDTDGNFIEEGKQIEYNSCFLVTILHLKIIDVKGFFNYHYDFTPDKEAYLDYLEFGILNHKSLDKGTRDFFQKLIDEKRKELSEPQQNTKELVSKLPPKGFEKIFTENIIVWNLFVKLVEVIVESKPKKEWYAQFSVIFQTLIETKVIPKNRHALYLKFCDENYNTDFTHYKKLKSNTSNHSTELIKSYLKDAKLIN